MAFTTRSSAGQALSVGALALAGLCLGCGGGGQALRPGSGQAQAGAHSPSGLGPGPAEAPSRRITTSEEAEAARRDLDYLVEGTRERARLFRDLLGFHVREAEQALSRGHQEDAFEGFSAALALFQPEELQDPAQIARSPEISALHALAGRIDAAFRRRGAHAQVVTALMVQRTLRPDDEGALRRYKELAGWLGGMPAAPQRGRDPAYGLGEPPPALVQDLEGAARLWPARIVVQELTTLYLAEAGGDKRGLRDLLGMAQRSPLAQPAFKLARLYLRTGLPQEGLRVVKGLPKLSPHEQTLVTLMERAFSPGAPPSEAVGLAMAMAQGPEEGEVSLAVCRELVRREPGAVVGHQCVGELAGRLERTGLAVRAYERARDLKPGDRSLWERLALLYQMRLSDLVGDERTAELEGALKQIEAHLQKMKALFPDTPPSLNLSGALAEVGRGYYNAGRIEDAVRYLDRSVNVEPNAGALELLGTVHLKREQGERALATLERARAVEMASTRADPMIKLYFRARVGRLIADAQDQLAGREGSGPATEARRAALRDWGQLLESDRLMPERRAEAELERGKLHYQLGDRAKAIEAFQAAVDAVPEEGQGRGQVYADAIAYLVQRGEIDEAVEAYHRALGRARVTEYLKVYCSLWVNDLLRRAGQPEDPLATAFLRSVQGGKWYAELARWATGQQGEEALLSRADTVGKKAEAHFYVAMRKLQGGAGPAERAKAEALLRGVLQSDMMAFFEYDMASYYLKKGAPSAPVLKGSVGRRGGQGAGAGAGPGPGRGKKDKKRPDGSI